MAKNIENLLLIPLTLTTGNECQQSVHNPHKPSKDKRCSNEKLNPCM